MSPSDSTKQATRREWQELGFFYDTDADARRWHLLGSPSGLRRFSQLLHEFCADPRNATLGEHEHYGPYMYLKVTTSPDCKIDRDGIHGSVAELTRFADLVAECLSDAEPSEILHVGREFAPHAEYDLVLEVKNEGFDPAEADPSLR